MFGLFFITENQPDFKGQVRDSFIQALRRMIANLKISESLSLIMELTLLMKEMHWEKHFQKWIRERWDIIH